MVVEAALLLWDVAAGRLAGIRGGGVVLFVRVVGVLALPGPVGPVVVRSSGGRTAVCHRVEDEVLSAHALAVVVGSVAAGGLPLAVVAPGGVVAASALTG